jgi:peptidyl-prolyl cis-trans isomerase C
MQIVRILLPLAAALCVSAQTPSPAVPPKPPTATTNSTSPDPSITSPDGVTVPLAAAEAMTIPDDRVVIQAGGIKITFGQIEQILQAYPETQRIYANGLGHAQFIDQVIRVLLLSEEGKRRKLDQTSIYRNQLTYSAAGILATHADDEVRREARASEAQLRAYYEAHKADYEMVHARHILIRTQGSPLTLTGEQKDLTDAEALAKATEIRQKIVDGASFADLARTESWDQGTNSKGGDMGFLKHGQTMPSFEEAAFALAAGELSQPVKTSYGYHLIKVDERKPARTFDEVRPDLERIAANEASRKFVEQLKAKTTIVIDPDFKLERGKMEIKP